MLGLAVKAWVAILLVVVFFFFLADGNKVVVGDNNFIHSERPLDLPGIPKLGG